MTTKKGSWRPSQKRIERCGRITKGPFSQKQFVQMQVAHPEMSNEWVVYSLLLNSFEQRNPHGLN